MNFIFLHNKAKFYAKEFVDSEIIRIFAPTESATLPVDQRTRAGLLLKQDLHIKPASPVRIGTGFLYRFILSALADNYRVIRPSYFSP